MLALTGSAWVWHLWIHYTYYKLYTCMHARPYIKDFEQLTCVKPYMGEVGGSYISPFPRTFFIHDICMWCKYIYIHALYILTLYNTHASIYILLRALACVSILLHFLFHLLFHLLLHACICMQVSMQSSPPFDLCFNGWYITLVKATYVVSCVYTAFTAWCKSDRGQHRWYCWCMVMWLTQPLHIYI